MKNNEINGSPDGCEKGRQYQKVSKVSEKIM